MSLARVFRSRSAPACDLSPSATLRAQRTASRQRALADSVARERYDFCVQLRSLDRCVFPVALVLERRASKRTLGQDFLRVSPPEAAVVLAPRRRVQVVLLDLLAAAFREADTDGDGQITMEEIQARHAGHRAPLREGDSN